MNEAPPARVRIGVFELNLRSGELCSRDCKTVLQEQPLRVLRILVEREGELVGREEIKTILWPNDTIVDFDHSINAAIKNLRRALSDSADNPKYIETLARRGYRLMVPAERVDDDDSSGEVVCVGGGSAVRLQAELGLIGKKVSHYRVLQVIGAGGMGLVYKAEDLKLGRQVALKFLPEELVTDQAALQRFEREAQTASSLNHPNICTIHEIEEYDGKPFIVMELLEGETLRDRLARAPQSQRALPLEQLLDIGVQISAGLQAPHEKGIIHRDIKPANLFLTTSGQVKILDFGIAKLVTAAEAVATVSKPSELKTTTADVDRPMPADPSLTRTGAAMGTAGYMSPEQVRGEFLDARTDLFSLGLVLYEMASGHRAFNGETQAILHNAILNTAPVPVHDLNSKLPPELETIVNKALEKDRDLRYQSAGEMLSDLQTISPKERVVARGRKLVATAAVVVLFALIAGGVYWYSHRAARLTEKDTIIIADFDNSTRDPVFDNGLSMALGFYLDQSPFFSRLSGRKLHAALKLLNYAPKESLVEERLSVALAREVCLSTNSKAMLTGTIADVGNRYRVEIRAVNCQTGATMATSTAEADNRDRVMAALGQAGNHLREELGEPSALRKQFNTPPDQALTSSPEALQAYLQGNRTSGQDAITYLNRATELDPGFAESFFSLGGSYNVLGSDALADRCWRKYYDLRSRLTQRRRLLAEGIYYFVVTGELEKYVETQKQTVKDYPGPKDNEGPHYALSMTYYSLGQHDEALAEAREQVRAIPDSPWSYMALLRVYCALDRLNDAKSTFDEAEARHQDGPIPARLAIRAGLRPRRQQEHGRTGGMGGRQA